MFDGIDFEDSFVLGWHFDEVERTFSLFLEFSVWPGHAVYNSPKEGEYTCYKRGRLVFEDVLALSGLKPMADVSANSDPDGSKDYGNIDSLREIEKNVFQCHGDFGDLTIKSRSPQIMFDTEAD